MIGTKAHQVIMGYQWIVTITGEWEHGYIVEVDERYKEQFELWGQPMTQYPFYSGVYR